MKAIILFSSFFFFLGLKIGNIIDLRGKAGNVDKIITNKILQSKPVKALQLFKNEDEAPKSEDKNKQEPEKQNNPAGSSDSSS
jgi:hypothetical protein